MLPMYIPTCIYICTYIQSISVSVSTIPKTISETNSNKKKRTMAFRTRTANQEMIYCRWHGRFSKNSHYGYLYDYQFERDYHGQTRWNGSNEFVVCFVAFDSVLLLLLLSLLLWFISDTLNLRDLRSEVEVIF